jgi:hypothetical protein
MSDEEVLTLRSLARIESIPAPLRDDALLDWRTVAALMGGKDIEYTREKFTERAAELGEKLVRTGPRRKLPSIRTFRKVMASFAE